MSGDWGRSSPCMTEREMRQCVLLCSWSLTSRHCVWACMTLHFLNIGSTFCFLPRLPSSLLKSIINPPHRHLMHAHIYIHYSCKHTLRAGGQNKPAGSLTAHKYMHAHTHTHNLEGKTDLQRAWHGMHTHILSLQIHRKLKKRKRAHQAPPHFPQGVRQNSRVSLYLHKLNTLVLVKDFCPWKQQRLQQRLASRNI